MKISMFAAVAAATLLLGSQPAAQAEDTSTRDSPAAAPKWPVEPRWTGPGPMPRHNLVTTWGVPEPYKGLTNPLPQNAEVRDQGLAIYKQYCAICHGENGAADAPASRHFKPPPGNLVWLSDIPDKLWDPFMYWTIAEGGTALGTSMPPYGQVLSAEEIWAVTYYIQENIPFVSRLR